MAEIAAYGPGGVPLAESDASVPAILRAHWRVVFAASMGWFLDAFDVTVFTFLITRLGADFGASLPAMGLVLSGTSWSKMVGHVVFGRLADRLGRKLPFMLGVLWFSVCSGLSGLAWSYGSLLVFRVLFGIGYGGEWSAGAALLMESLPARARSVASGIMMSGYEVGLLLAAACYALIYPIWGWRVMFFLGVLPALLALFVRIGVPESPVWTQRRAEARTRTPFRVSKSAVQGWLFMFVLQAHGIFALYPTLLTAVRHFSPGRVFPFVAVYSVASIIGKPLIGALAARFGQTRVIIIYLVLSVPAVILSTQATETTLMVLGPILLALFENSLFGLVPVYLSRRFPAEHRSLGMGIGYAAAGAGAALSAWLVTAAAARYGLADAMMVTGLGGAAITAAIAAYRPPALQDDADVPV